MLQYNVMQPQTNVHSLMWSPYNVYFNRDVENGLELSLARKITIDFDDVNIMNLGSGASLYHIPFLFTSEIFENFEFGFAYHF